MARKSRAIADFQAKYKVAEDELWEVHGSTWCVKHKALERIAAEVGIVWEKPELKVCDMANGLIAILVGGRLGDHLEFSFGEASPKNNKNAYPIAMAEKRAKDRVILKLLAVHGDLYSEEEAEDFKQPRQNPHVTKPADIWDDLTVDIPWLEVSPMLVKDTKPEYAQLIKEMIRNQSVESLKEWRAAVHEQVSAYAKHWRDFFTGAYNQYKKELETGTSIHHHKQAAE
jgi:hypothetical protein